MCGIVGVVGKPAKDIILNGLTNLEYRGYDSAGIYLNDLNGNEYLTKAVGRISNLKEKLTPDEQGLVGIGHTRWATHGKPTVDNAHPHFDETKRFYLVHNGVIENYTELKEKYLQGVKFHSDTDTEVVVQLIGKIARDKNLDAFSAFKEALKLVKGSYAFLLVDNTEPDHVFIAKNKSPMMLGIGDGFNIIASDAISVLDQTKTFVDLQDGDVGDITKDSYTIETVDGKKVDREPHVLNIDPNAASKGTYEFYMLKEIDEQPGVMRHMSQNYLDENGEPKIDQDIVDAISKADRLYIFAAGTSYHAGLVGKTIFEHYTGIPTEVGYASEAGYHFPMMSKHPFFIFLTQSGETADSRVVLKEANKRGIPSLTMTNVEGSTLSREANYTMLLGAGPEIAVASTKAYTAQVALQAILAKALGEKLGNQDAKDWDLQHDLAIAAEGIQQIVDGKEKLKELADQYLVKSRNAFYIGRGIDHAVALEGALKLKEVSYIQTEGFAAAELKHGTISLIEDGTPVIALINDPVTADLTRGNIQEVASRGASVITIVGKEFANSDDTIVLPEINYYMSALLTVVPTQLLAYYASKDKGLDVDKPRNLAKSVTVE
ncbi:MAG: glutamine--fructose-6-phosphate transaminase (isomerizing) [Lactobacillus crispatus]|jgi:glucosamine--fructose-6-phosphate aminotransferase (isomerizing)|uniref:glutamine--fructose-6-phosphate transaminase (isomerizing) n=1 Tax=Lactobacillus crispatus TaxID=47770 RepID=UPI0018AB3F9C|nr:glutamine--fructose-6-phosphate transaminase (isomerizing) [Lactobacillus crispatus]MCH4005333.1 glutamine--fructose-6-phosphate transaminase (isomerizing) [Lactobacillus crispatus]MCI1336148.1 glutamine--fructose-6-phosphate transaminase (isomerizing) [Lactobacillus crispatus]MCI1365693.1 glutamine--fructose-6-phosphate transaminase (isomerizing) [Lactobacillus crispatus]MCI1492838.1 glutamine--fructose-6-phosphate transaminase (isomerizing) [Lactobacillus crispatus]MCI1524107.1 glutamine-